MSTIEQERIENPLYAQYEMAGDDAHAARRQLTHMVRISKYAAQADALAIETEYDTVKDVTRAKARLQEVDA